MTKMTYVQALEIAIAIMERTEAYEAEAVTQNEAIEKLTALRQSYINRAEKAKTYERKPSKATQENAKLKEQIVNWLAEQKEAFTSAEIAEAVGIGVRTVRALLPHCEKVEAVRISSKVTKWQVKGEA